MLVPTLYLVMRQRLVFSRLSVIVAVFAFSLTLSTASHAQTSAQVHQFVRPGYPAISLYVLGSAGQPGIWQVEQGIDFIELLTLLNVASRGGGSPEVETTILLHLYRRQGGARELIYDATLDETLTVREALPTVVDGDILVVEPEARRKFSIRTSICWRAA